MFSGGDGLSLPCVQKVAEHLQQRPELLPTLLTTLFEIVLFEECSNQWSLSRPMLSLILINEQVGLCAESLAPKLISSIDTQV